MLLFSSPHCAPVLCLLENIIICGQLYHLHGNWNCSFDANNGNDLNDSLSPVAPLQHTIPVPPNPLDAQIQCTQLRIRWLLIATLKSSDSNFSNEGGKVTGKILPVGSGEQKPCQRWADYYSGAPFNALQNRALSV